MHHLFIELSLSYLKAFNVNQQLESHLVYDHGHERKHQCPHCPQKFIRHGHKLRHIKQFHSPTQKEWKIPRISERAKRRSKRDEVQAPVVSNVVPGVVPNIVPSVQSTLPQ